MTEEELRAAVVAEARSWCGTPYVPHAMVKKGPVERGGVDCAMILVGVFGAVGMIPPDFDPRPYPTQWHMHGSTERYMGHVRALGGREVETTLPGNIVLFRIGRCYSHGGIITSWPRIVHAFTGSPVMELDVSRITVGRYALGRMDKKFFSLWG